MHNVTKLNENTVRVIEEVVRSRKVKVLAGMYDALGDHTVFRIEFKKNQYLSVSMLTEIIENNWKAAANHIIHEIDKYLEDK